MKIAHIPQHAPAVAGATTDPVCGMNVDPATAFGSHDYGGQTYWFCSSAVWISSGPGLLNTPWRSRRRDPRLGYVVDHIVPLKRGGRDEPGNMQWQTVAEAKARTESNDAHTNGIRTSGFRR